MDCLYEVEPDPFSMNHLVQNIDMLAECGHYDHANFPWHAAMVDQQCAQLMDLIKVLNTEERVSLVIGIARIPIEPVVKIVNHCLTGMSSAQFSLYAMEYLIDRVVNVLYFM